MGAVLRFPVQSMGLLRQGHLGPPPAQAVYPIPPDVAENIAPEPILDAIDQAKTRMLLGTAKYVIDGGRALIRFVDQNRQVARETGVETLAVELAAIIDSGRLDTVRDALEESALKGGGSRLSMDGLGYLKRAERVLAEAAGYLGTPPAGSARGGSVAYLGQAESAQRSGMPSDFVILGVVAIAAIAVVSIVLATR